MTSLSFVFILVFLLHFLGDYVFQTDKMALGKSSSNKALLLHTSVYSMVFLGLGFLPFFSWLQTAFFILVNFVAHTLTDYFTSREAKKAYEAGDRHKFFVILGFDQFLHAAVLLLTLFVLVLPELM